MKHKLVQQHKYYSLKGDVLERTRRFCPKCSVGRLAQHKNRLSCGKCGYGEILNV